MSQGPRSSRLFSPSSGRPRSLADRLFNRNGRNPGRANNRPLRPNLESLEAMTLLSTFVNISSSGDVFTVQRDSTAAPGSPVSPSTPLTVSLDIDTGSSALSSDYSISGGTVSGSTVTVIIPANQATKTLTITPVNTNNEAKPNETLTLDVNTGPASPPAPASEAYSPGNDASSSVIIAASGTVVTTTATGMTLSGTDIDGSLNAAIDNVNAFDNGSSITFNIPTTDPGYNSITKVWTITPATSLPALTVPTTINGYTQPGSTANTVYAVNATNAINNAKLKIQIDGTTAGGVGLEFEAGSGGSTVEGLWISNWFHGIEVDDTNGNTFTGNFLGDAATGFPETFGNFDGLYLDNSSGNIIGGTTPALQNLISGNFNNGIDIKTVSPGTTVSGNLIQGNVITANGDFDEGPEEAGIRLLDTDGNTIGGTTAGAANLINGNTEGIYVEDSSASGAGNLIEGNYIGTTPSGTDAVPNDDGIELDDSTSTTIGGTTAGARNIISGNIDGIYIEDSGLPGNVVEGNYIGTDVTGKLAVGNEEDGVQIFDSGANTIGGTTAGARNIISANGDNGVEIDGGVVNPLNAASALGNLVEGNYIGTDVTGTLSLGNGYGDDPEFGNDGVYINDDLDDGEIYAGANTVGGTTAGARNIISDNYNAGVEINDGDSGEEVRPAAAVDDSPTAGNVVEGNYIGTDVTGTKDIGNYYGVLIEDSTFINTVGGSTAGARNIISANYDVGIAIDYSEEGDLVEGNYIGTDVTGTKYLSNYDGIDAYDSDSVTIGGTTAGDRNVISGNDDYAIDLDFSYFNLIEGNYIGTNATNTGPLSNFYGVEITDDSYYNTIGGTSAGQANIIANSDVGPGILVDDTSVLNTIEENSIYNNGTLGSTFGIADNPLGQYPPPAIPDVIQEVNAPVLTSATNGVIAGTESDLPDAGDTFRIEYFASPAPGEGQVFLGSQTVTSSGFGTAILNFKYTPILGDPYITATATISVAPGIGSTSGYSLAVRDRALLTPTLVVNNVAGNAGTPIPLTIVGSVSTTTGPEALTYQISGVPTNATLNQGTNLGHGVWSLTQAQTSGLTITEPNPETFTLTVTATGADPYATAGTLYKPAIPTSISVTKSITVTVSNVAPTVKILPVNPTTGAETTTEAGVNQLVDLVFTAAGPSPTVSAAGYTFTINWGDGSAPEVIHSTQLDVTVTHFYSKPGTFKETVTATDSQGAVSSAATNSITIFT